MAEQIDQRKTTPTGVNLRQGPAPKTIKVKSEEHDGAEVVINEADFDEEIHTKSEPAKRVKVKPSEDEGKLGEKPGNPPSAGKTK